MSKNYDSSTRSVVKTIYLKDGYIFSITNEKPNQNLKDKFDFAVVVKRKAGRLSIKLIQMDTLSTICKLYENDIKALHRKYQSSSWPCLKDFPSERERFVRNANSTFLNQDSAIHFTYLVYIMSSTPILYINIGANEEMIVNGLFNTDVFSYYEKAILLEKREDKPHSLVMLNMHTGKVITSISNVLFSEYLRNSEYLCKSLDTLLNNYLKMQFRDPANDIKKLTFILAYENMTEKIRV